MIQVTRLFHVKRTGALAVAACMSACAPQKPPTTTLPTPPVTSKAPTVAVTPPATHERAALGTLAKKRDAVFRAVNFSDLPDWDAQDFAGSLESFVRGCVKLKNIAGWGDICRYAKTLPNDQPTARQFFEHYFTPWEVAQNQQLAGLVTGYYEPVIAGDIKPTATARFPIYAVPDDLISVTLPAHLRQSSGTVRLNISGKTGNIAANGAYTAKLSQFHLSARSGIIKGRIVGQRFVPYHSRKEIIAGAIDNKARVLAWANDPVELFFMQVQGSGRVKLPNGELLYLGYADKNDLPYASIGRYMLKKGYLQQGQASAKQIQAWLKAHPKHLAEVLSHNPSFVFFRLQENGDGPTGALGVPLKAGFAGAVDRRYITLGAPIFVATTHPGNQRALNRLIAAQDTGSAINGAVRVDYFWGYGDAAGEIASKMKHIGYLWQLLPNGLLP